jgi:hypothetical protein
MATLTGWGVALEAVATVILPILAIGLVGISLWMSGIFVASRGPRAGWLALALGCLVLAAALVGRRLVA